MPMSVVLIDDHQMFREALLAVLHKQADFRILGDTGSGWEGLALVDDWRPDVVLMDIALGNLDGIAVAGEMKRRQPPTRILFLSMHGDAEHVARALEVGGRGYVFKEQSTEDLFQAIRTVGHGQEYLPPQLSRFALDDERARLRETRDARPLAPGAVGPVATPARRSDESARFDHLTAREKELFRLLVRGDNNRQIAHDLHISVKTVETHRARILKKLDAHTMADLVRFAARHALL